MKVLLLGLTIFCVAAATKAQKYGNVWQFGNQIGLDFNGCNPVVVTGNNTGFEGCSTIADSTGQLLFYTNSDKVWDKLHNLMPNGDLLFTGGSLSQVIIIPKPLSIDLFYIITTDLQANGNFTLEYHEVDMALNGGLGDVLSSNNVLSELTITEQIAATYHSNGIDIWLMTHEYGTSNFYAFLVTSTGISSTPTISNIGPSHVACTSNFNARGEIKFSPDGNKLAFNGNGIGGNDPSNVLALFDFDNETGLVSNPINLPFSRGEFGLSFSPDNSKLYGSTWKAFSFTLNDYNYLYQFDLSSGIPSTIINSRQVIDSMQVGSNYGTLKIGPDGKIYVRRTNSAYIGIINSPNLFGAECNYDQNGIFVGNQNNQYGLNNYIEYVEYIQNEVVSEATLDESYALCPGGQIALGVIEEEGATYLWSTGATTAQIEVVNTGPLTLTVTTIDGCSFILQTQVVQAPPPVLTISGPEFICLNDTAVITASVNDYEGTFTWLDGTIGPEFTALSAGNNTVSFVSTEGCSTSETFMLPLGTVPEIEINGFAGWCPDLPATLEAMSTEAEGIFSWSNGTIGSITAADTIGLFTVTFTPVAGCETSASILVFLDVPIVLAQDTTLCDGDFLILQFDSPNANVSWPGLSDSASVRLDETGTYLVEATNNCGSIAVTVEVGERDCTCPTIIPNVFTPNGDGLNDVFEIAMECDPLNYSLSVFNRWGREVFQTSQYTDFWQGNSSIDKGNEAAEGVYFYVLSYQNPLLQSMKRSVYTGIVTLIR